MSAAVHDPQIETPPMEAPLARGFIGLGALFFTPVISDPTLSFAAGRVLGGIVFCLGLLLVVVTGVDTTGIAHIDALTWTGRVRNLVPVPLGTLVGGGVTVALVDDVVHRRGAPTTAEGDI